MRGCSYHTAGSFPDTCEPCRLESRINALTAELEQAKAYAAKADEALLDCATAYATERAARELAEAGLLSEQEGKAVLVQDLEQAERERDAALADWRHVIEESAKNRDEQLRLFGALEAVALENERGRVAAESALASARKKLDGLMRAIEDNYGECADGTGDLLEVDGLIDADAIYEDLKELRERLSSAPSPAPCSGCAAARELLVLWYHNRSETESGELIEVETQNWLKEHANG